MMRLPNLLLPGELVIAHFPHHFYYLAADPHDLD